MVQNASSAVVTLDSKGVVTFWGKACEEITGWPASAALGKNFASLVLRRDELDFTTNIVAEVFAGRMFTGVELDFYCRDGTVRKMQSRGCPLVGPDETVMECAIESIDVTGQKLVEAELAVELKKFRALYELGLAMTAEHDLDKKLSLVVEKSRELLRADTSYIALRDEEAGEVYMHTLSGIRSEAFKKMRLPVGAGLGGKVAKTGRGYIIQDYFKEIEPLVHDTVRSEGVISGIAVPIQIGQTSLGVLYVFNRTKTSFSQGDLDTLFLMGNLAAVEIQRNRTEQALQRAREKLERRVEVRTSELLDTVREMEREIIERKRVESALRESEEKYRTILETIEDAYYEVDLAGNFTFLNDPAPKTLGYDKEAMIGRNFREFVHDEKALRELAMVFNGVYTTGEPVSMYRARFTGRDMIERVLEVSVSLIRDSDGHPSGFRGLCRDVTERQRAEEELLRLDKLESIGVLAGGIAHDFNNILTAIRGNISIAKLMAGERDKIFQRLDEAEMATIRARDLIGQLLTFSRGGAPIRKTASIADIVRDSCQFVLRGSSCRCEFSIPEDVWSVEVDTGQISQVMSNLAINAAHAMPQGGIVQVTTENFTASDEHGVPLPAGKYVRILVHDQGCGISPEHLGRIFDPYFTTKNRGSGLGLTTSYSIVKNHGGLITVESEPAVGTKFHVYLPASPSETVPMAETGNRHVRGKGRVLLMDDEEPIRDLAQEMLEWLGYEAALARDGSEAIDMYKSAMDSGHPFDGIILDLTVPGGMGGIEAIGRLLEIDPGVKAIVSSGYSNDPVMADYQKRGFKGVVPKPYSIQELGTTLRRVVMERKA